MLSHRHLGLTSTDRESMLTTLGISSLDELIDRTIPSDIRLKEPLDLPEPISQADYLTLMADMAAQNDSETRCLIGQGFYGTRTPAVITRCVFQNPSWYTSYTPYQAEISQGRLEALFSFQTVVSDLTGLPIANCSLLDEATAAAEAVTMMFHIRTREQIKAGVSRIFVDERIFTTTRAVLLTRAAGQGITLEFGTYETFTPDASYCGALIQLPNAHGSVEDYAAFIDDCHGAGMRVAAILDPMAMALLRPLDYDIACGSMQRFGLPIGFGGPTAAFMACRDEFKRDIPGRIIGLSRDTNGHPAFRLALQTREQHIKREKATSNICTSEALSAMMVAFYAIYHGPEGIRHIAESIHAKATYLAEMMSAYGIDQLNAEFFDTLRFVPDDMSRFRQLAEDYGFDFYYTPDGEVMLSLDESVSLDTMNDLIALFADYADAFPCPEDSEEAFEGLWTLDEERVREVDYLHHEVFALYHSETELMRYIHRLQRRDISLTDSMIPLGSCTMKLNPAATMLPITLPGFLASHPMAPSERNEGYIRIMTELRSLLATVTGFADATLQPQSGAAGEYTGLVLIREYLRATHQEQRRVLLIPASAHGTNPASCVQAGFTPVVVACDAEGNTDLEDWNAKAAQYADTLAGCMITYPSTHGIFEQAIRSMCDTIHRNGGQVYMDGANMNAQLGYTNPAACGADVCHLNLHKSFAAPHGGGGPGAGAVCCAEHLVPYLNTAVASAPYGNANIALIGYGYLRMMGESGLRAATADAILAANYMAARLREAYGIVYTGVNGTVGHELILDCRQFHAAGITETDIAKRLMDYGFHAPTLSFPVHGTLMIEPTESESLAELDRFITALLTIRQEIDTCPQLLQNAPHAEYELMADEWERPYLRSQAAYPAPWCRSAKFHIPVSRVDNGFGDRNLVARW